MKIIGTDRRTPVPVKFGTSSEEERGFYQGRLRLFTGCIFLISTAFYIVDVAFSAPALGVALTLSWTPKVVHLVGTLLAGASWMLLRRVRIAGNVLRHLDAGATMLLSTCYALMALAALNLDRLAHVMVLNPWRAATDPLLACTYVILVRALAIPSHPGRTLWISAVSMVPMVTVGLYVLQRHMSGLELRFSILDLALWSVAAVAVSGISSRVIFGLRTEVAKVKRLGQYTLEEKIGEGGMGIVYRASPAMLRRPIAIKLLPPGRISPATLRQFEREVQLTARLTHPNTVAVFDYGRTPEGLFYYAMEYLDGLNLDQLVADDGPQPAGRVVHILTQVCGSLAEAHRVGLIHRDIKAANILLVERGGVPDVVKVVDFGLARQVKTLDSEATRALTTTTLIRGTPLYLSPEAIRNDPTVGARSDLYAVGAVAYFLLTGRPVFQADTVVEIFSHHLHTAPTPPSAHAPGPVSAKLDELILQCLAKDPADRPPDAAALQDALLRCRCEPVWSTADAAAWWAQYHARRARSSRRAAVPRDTPLPTMTVDIRERVKSA